MLLFALRRTALACAIIFCAIALLFGLGLQFLGMGKRRRPIA